MKNSASAAEAKRASHSPPTHWGPEGLGLFPRKIPFDSATRLRPKNIEASNTVAKPYMIWLPPISLTLLSPRPTLFIGPATMALLFPNMTSSCPPQSIGTCYFICLGHSPGTFAWQVSAESSPLSLSLNTFSNRRI